MNENEQDNENVISVSLNIIGSRSRRLDINATFNLSTMAIEVYDRKDSSLFDDENIIQDMYIVSNDYEDIISSVSGDFSSGFTADDAIEFRNDVLFQKNKEQTKNFNNKISLTINELFHENRQGQSSELENLYNKYKNLPGIYILNLEDGTFLNKDVTLNIFSGEVSFPIKETTTNAPILSETATFVIDNQAIMTNIISENKIDALSQEKILSLFEEHAQKLESDLSEKTQITKNNSWKI